MMNQKKVFSQVYRTGQEFASSTLHSPLRSSSQKPQNSNKISIILCEYLLSMEEEGEIKKDQMIVVEGSKIHSVGPIPESLPQAEEVIRLNNHLVCPGLINTHTHLPMVLFRGLGDHLTLKSWLEDIIFPLEKKMVNPDFIRLGTELALLELIKSGVTSVCDMYFHTPVMAEVFESYGLRGVLAVDMLSSFSDWKEDLDYLCDRYKGNNQLVYPAIACHAPYTCSAELLKMSAQEARDRKLPVAIHVAETQWEISEIKKRYGKTPVAHLKDCGIIGPHCVFVHCVHVNETDMDIMVETGTPLSYNPESNMKLGSGTAPILRALEKGITIGMGTDGAASNNNLNLFTEMDTGAKLQKLSHPSKTISARDIFSMVTSSAAKVLGLSHCIGKIQAGFFADIMALNLDHPHLYPRNDLLNHLVYSASGGEVDFVMCHGKVLMKESEIQGVDMFRVYASAEMIKEKIKQAL